MPAPAPSSRWPARRRQRCSRCPVPRSQAAPAEPGRASAGGRKYSDGRGDEQQQRRQPEQPSRTASSTPSRWTSTPGRSRNGAFRPSPTCSSRWPAGGGSRRSTGAGSIFSARQTVCASARANVGVGQRVEAVGLEQLELLRRHLDRRRRARRCAGPGARAPRAAVAPALGAAPGRRCRRRGSSLIERARVRTPPPRATRGKRLRSCAPNSAAPCRLPSLCSIRAASHSVCALATSGCALTRRM